MSLLLSEEARKQLQCCYIEDGTGVACSAPATYEIIDGPAPDDYTHACADHVGLLLSDAPLQTVYRLDVATPQAAVAEEVLPGMTYTFEEAPQAAASPPIPAHVDDPSTAGAVRFNLYDVHETLRRHYLAAMAYDKPAPEHGPGVKPVCACGIAFPYWMPTRGEALSVWLGHVETELMAQADRRPF